MAYLPQNCFLTKLTDGNESFSFDLLEIEFVNSPSVTALKLDMQQKEKGNQKVNVKSYSSGNLST